MTTLLSEYAELYKLAYRDVSAAHDRGLGQEKQANRFAKVMNKVQDFVAPQMKGLSDEAMEGARAAGADSIEDLTSALSRRSGMASDLQDLTARHADEGYYIQNHPRLPELLESAGIEDVDELLELRKTQRAAQEAGGQAAAQGGQAAAQGGQAAAQGAGQAAGEAAEGGSNALRNTLLAGGAVGAAGIGGHQYGAAQEREKGIRNRNLAFGAGAAAGMAAPGLMQNIGKTLSGVGNLTGSAPNPRQASPGPRPPSAPRPHAQSGGGMSPQQRMMLRQRGY